ncbi:MAG: hypothetical protein ACREYA_23805 [Cupriavidus necator]
MFIEIGIDTTIVVYAYSTAIPGGARDAALAARAGAAIAELRRARGLTQAKLAEMIDLEQEAVSHIRTPTRVSAPATQRRASR